MLCGGKPQWGADTARNVIEGANGTGTLILAAVPIGRAEDASPRLAAELARADIVAAEDTRRARRLPMT